MVTTKLCFLETSLPGLFAAGDVRHGSVKRCASGTRMSLTDELS